MKYGDYDNVTKDSETIYEIYDRQGFELILGCIAERVGQTAAKFELGGVERMRMANAIINHLKEDILERI